MRTFVGLSRIGGRSLLMRFMMFYQIYDNYRNACVGYIVRSVEEQKSFAERCSKVFAGK